MPPGEMPLRQIRSGHTPPRTWVDTSELPDRISLDVANIARLAISRSGCDVAAPDDQTASLVVATFGQWALAQWMALNGAFAFAGVTLARDDVVLALLGAPRAGTSLVGLSLINRGWQLIADGVCPLVVDGDGRHLIADATLPDLQVDQVVTQMFPPSQQSQDAGTSRLRTNIAVPRSTGSEVTRLFSLQPTHIRTEAVLVPVEPESAASTLRAHAVVGDAVRSACPEISAALAFTCEQAVDIVPIELLLVPSGDSADVFSPAKIADAVQLHVEPDRLRKEVGA